jgi:hypothetical protein
VCERVSVAQTQKQREVSEGERRKERRLKRRAKETVLRLKAFRERRESLLGRRRKEEGEGRRLEAAIRSPVACKTKDLDFKTFYSCNL